MTQAALCAVHVEVPANGVCVRCGAFACDSCRAGTRYCASCRAREPAAVAPNRRRWATLVGGLVPLAAWLSTTLSVNAMRPDLAKAMWNHIFSWLTVALVIFVSTLAALIGRLLARIRRPVLSVALLLAFVFIASWSTVFIALFAPIVFAFMYGSVQN